MSSAKKLLPCFFFSDLKCPHRKSKTFTGYMLSTWCEKCPHFKRFNREMAEEEDAFFEEVEKIRKYGYPKSFSDFKKESEKC